MAAAGAVVDLQRLSSLRVARREETAIELQRGDDEAYERFRQAVDVPMLVLSLLFIPIVVVPWVFDVSEAVAGGLEAGAWLIWAVFVFEYLALLYLAADKREMVRTHVFDLVIIVLPFLRPLRAARVLRLLRLGAGIGRATVAVRRLLGRRGFGAFLGVVLLLIVASGSAVWLLERPHGDAQITSWIDGIWWALVTSTTVGYGDMVPVTAEGRGVATILMLVGIALLSVVTANIAAFFVEDGTDQDTSELLDRLDRIERLLSEQANEDTT